MPDAVIVKRGAGVVESMTVPRFIAPREALLNGGRLRDFHAWETEAETHVAGFLAMRLGRYRKSGVRDGAPQDGSGMKHVLLVLREAGWRIVWVVWEDDT